MTSASVGTTHDSSKPQINIRRKNYVQWVNVPVGVCMLVKAKVCVDCLSQLLYTICFDARSLTDLKPPDVGRLGDQPGIPLSPPPQC